MKHLLIITLALAMPVLTRAADTNSPAASSATDKAAIIKMEKDWAVAFVKKDTAKMLSLGSPDCWFTSSAGEVVTLEDFVGDVKSGAYTVRSMHIDDLKVRLYGDTAVVLGLETEKSRYKGQDSSGQYRYTDTWLKRDGRWLCVTSANILVTPTKH
jgi:ketosteroid isomerase-like protein